MPLVFAHQQQGQLPQMYKNKKPQLIRTAVVKEQLVEVSDTTMFNSVTSAHTQKITYLLNLQNALLYVPVGLHNSFRYRTN